MDEPDNFPVYSTIHWRQHLFKDCEIAEVGQRLGINYVRAMRPILSVKFGATEIIDFQQEPTGVLAISGVIWDAGLLLSDFLWSSVTRGYRLGSVLDVGCGTGICGISALHAKADFVMFTDVTKLDSFDANIENLPHCYTETCDFCSYDWNDPEIPPSIKCPPSARGWDLVLCSDLLYDERNLSSLLRLLGNITFKKAIFSYKKRHAQPECRFFAELEEVYNISVIDTKCVEMINLNQNSLSGLYLIHIAPKS